MLEIHTVQVCHNQVCDCLGFTIKRGIIKAQLTDLKAIWFVSTWWIILTFFPMTNCTYSYIFRGQMERKAAIHLDADMQNRVFWDWEIMLHVWIWNCSLEFPDPLRASQAQQSLIPFSCSSAKFEHQNYSPNWQPDGKFPKTFSFKSHGSLKSSKKNIFWEEMRTTSTVIRQTWANHNSLQLMFAR